MAKNKLRLVQLGETAAEVILAVQSQPVSKFIQRRSLRSGPIEHEQCLLSWSQVTEYDRVTVDLLYRRHLLCDEVLNDLLSTIGVNTVVEADQLAKNPIHAANDKRCILKIRVDSIP